MRCLRSLWRGGKAAALALACWTVLFGAALAKDQPKQPEKDDRGLRLCVVLRIGDLGHCLGDVVCVPFEQPPRSRPARTLR